ncbi:hypothetical protein Cgig2_031383 [Carnegiea gigantea]|uniref:WD repeat-containing protein 55 n=1 Tax=Carnegiea gigantea TaxID=171969 RepID=A0A9Q1K7Q7_9CARY|nr:hypothetical protein Cgig2_031383 [Carnegiea gigantea]
MEINLGGLPFDVDFHPSDSLVTAGLINGYLLLYRYAGVSEPQRLLKVRAHKKSCRAARFINDGRAILTGSPDCSILATDVETGAKIAHLEHAHTAPINRIINLTESTIASGDDEGCIKVQFLLYEARVDFYHLGWNWKVWDTRQQSCCGTFEVHEEYISDMTFASDSMRLLATSGDGTLSVCNLRSNKVQAQSEFSEDELLSVVIMKLDEDRLITGSYNGLISLVGILPNRIIQPIAEHSEYPVERLAFSHDKNILGSISHDQILKLWDMDELLQGPSNVARNDSAVSDSDSDGMDVDSDLPKPSKGTKTKNAGNGQASSSSFNEFFADL